MWSGLSSQAFSHPIHQLLFWKECPRCAFAFLTGHSQPCRIRYLRWQTLRKELGAIGLLLPFPAWSLSDLLYFWHPVQWLFRGHVGSYTTETELVVAPLDTEVPSQTLLVYSWWVLLQVLHIRHIHWEPSRIVLVIIGEEKLAHTLDTVHIEGPILWTFRSYIWLASSQLCP